MTTPNPPGSATSAQDTRLGDWIRTHQTGLWRYLRLLGADDADDLVQETFIRYLQRHRPEPGAGALLRVIARGMWIDRQRWRARRAEREHADRIDELVAASEMPLSSPWLDALAECRSSLAPKAQSAIDLFYRRDHSRAEVAAALEMSEHGARNLLARSRKSLKTCIESKLAGEVTR